MELTVLFFYGTLLEMLNPLEYLCPVLFLQRHADLLTFYILLQALQYLLTTSETHLSKKHIRNFQISSMLLVTCALGFHLELHF